MVDVGERSLQAD